MYAVKGIYQGDTFKTIQPIPVDGDYEVIITFIQPVRKQKRPLSELRGFMKGDVWMADDFNAPLDEMKEYME